ncbi:uncharacterized protein TRIREDRAFT_119895 [Trichoderma reesei QM6a]|jgi:hypothetical protein|uniref:Predicted protein n=2 Tax=Hypocrea jecorina TaxID=51453 RepID=G0R763_HYPJQ|nr:uncharacterized protein TRIREDRAFT_119895 [Trichoderma reesei QM6a]EGR52530.1 predicted protein [Trichoderma reesei QM6a]ETS00036.1 hypothetical protein M419DRAFT_142249 [Trichoderma reesei RUT C-30]
MASDEMPPDLLRTTEATPIAKLSPAIADTAAVVVEGVVTVTWPYSIVRKSVAFILAERDPLHRRDKGQLRVEFDGAAGKALAGSGLGGGDEVRLSLDGARWEETQASMLRPGILEWQLRFSNRLLLKVRRADTHEVDTIEVDAPGDEAGQESPEQLREPSPTPSIELEHNLFATPLPRTPLSTIPQKRYAYETLGAGEYASPAFIKRARVSYGSLFEGGFDIFDEEESAKKTKKKRKPRFSMGPTAWRYASRSPTPEAEQEESVEEEDEPEARADDVQAPAVEEQTDKQAEAALEPPASQPQPQPVMVDQGCQTRELSSSPTRGVQIIAESRSTGVLLQPTPTHPWKRTDTDDVLQEPSPISFDFAVTRDAHPLTHEPEPLDQSRAHVPHSGFDMPMDLDPSLRLHEADGQLPHHQPTYDLAATEAPPPRPQEPGAHDAQLHGLAWAAEALAPEYSAVPRHNALDFPQGSFDRSSYTLQASPSDETHTLASSAHHGVEMHGYVRVEEAQRVPSSSIEQENGVKPSDKFPERYEDDAETATVTATLGRESRSSPPQEESSTEESEEDGDESAPHRYYDWNTGRWREGYPEDEDDDQRYAGYDDEDDELEEDEDDDDDDDEDGEEDDEVDSQGSDAESGSQGESEEDEFEPHGYHQTMQPMPPTHRSYFQAPKPAPAPPKEPVFISLLSDDEDDADNAPTTTHLTQPTQPKKEPSEERMLYDHDDIRDQSSGEEDEVVDEALAEDVDKYIDEDVEEDIDDHRDDTKDEDMDDNSEDAGDELNVEEDTKARMGANDTSSRRSSRISQVDGADDSMEHHEEPAANQMPHLEMDHPNLILSPKADRKDQQHAAAFEDAAQVQDEPPRAKSPSESRDRRRDDVMADNAIDKEEMPSVVMHDTSPHRSPEPPLIRTTSIIIDEKGESLPSKQKPVVQEREQPTELLEAEDSTAAEEPSIRGPEEPMGIIDAVETLAQHITGNDDLVMQDLPSNPLEVQPSAVDVAVEVEVEVEVTAVEQDVEMEDDVQSQLIEEAESFMQEEDNQLVTDMASKDDEEPEVAAPSSPPDTQTEPSHRMPAAIPTLEEQEATEQLETSEQLPTPLETQQEDYREDHGSVDMVQPEVSLEEDEADQSVDEDVDKYEDADEGANEDADEDFEDAREGEDDGDDDDLAIQQQLIFESQHYASPLSARDADRAGQTSLQLPETIAEVDESQQSPQSQQQDIQQDSPQSHHSHHSHHDHHGHHHTEHCSHERSPRRGGTEMSIGLQSLRSHCRAKRMSSGSVDSLSTDPSVLLARGSPTMAHRQCLLGDGDSLPQRSPRSPRNKAEHSDPSVALAKSSPRDSISPKQAEVTPSLRARRGIRGSDASIILAQTFSTPLELSPASPTRSFKAGQRKSEKPDMSVQLATASLSKDDQAAPQHQEDHAETDDAPDGTHEDSAVSRRDATPEQAVAGHNLRSPRKPTASSSFKAPSVASSVAEEGGNVATLKLQLLRTLRTKLPDCLPLKSLRTSLTKTADVLAVATLTPRQPHRPKHGPRDYMLELHLTDPSVAPTSVNVAHIFRPHQASLPTVQAGDVVLLRRVQVVSMQGRGFGVRAGEASAWAVFEKGDEEMLPQIKGPPVEVSEEEIEYVLGLRRWWGFQDEKALAKIDKANQKMLQAVKDDPK